VRLFLDSSVLLAASGSNTGASHEMFNRAASNDWLLIATPYVIEEVLQTFPSFQNPPAQIGRASGRH